MRLYGNTGQSLCVQAWHDVTLSVMTVPLKVVWPNVALYQ